MHRCVAGSQREVAPVHSASEEHSTHACVVRSHLVPVAQFGSAWHSTHVPATVSQYALGGAQSPSPEQPPAVPPEPPAPPVASAPPLLDPALPPDATPPPTPPVADAPPVPDSPPSTTPSPTWNCEKSLVHAAAVVAASATFADADKKPRNRIDLERYHGLENEGSVTVT